MNTLKLVLAIVCGIAVLQGIFVGLLLLFKKKFVKVEAVLIGLTVLGISLRIAKSYAYYIFDEYFLLGLILGSVGLFLI